MLEQPCADCPMLAEGALPRCWMCARTAWTLDAADALAVHQLLGQGMSWELALTAIGWVGTRDELRMLAEHVAIVTRELAPLRAAAAALGAASPAPR